MIFANVDSELILNTVRQIPHGKVTTYGKIAKLCGLINQARTVGHVLNRLPAGNDIPWYRVINARGMISFPKDSSGYKQQKRLLKKEGIVFKDDRIDLCRYDWLKSER